MLDYNQQYQYMSSNNNRDYFSTSTGSRQMEAPSYSVKYLGIVDGSMGVLSRKMALQSYNQIAMH